ncbi:hypothetical protein KPL70_020649 [Citrus sinensis]|nr:hypothetical protein KPL70_020649 [Citrus sinensis]
MVSEPAMSTSNITSSSFIKEPSLNIQSFHQCSSLVSIKLDNTNFLLWRSQVLPLVRSLGILHHITDAERPAKEILLSDGEKAGNEDFTMWTNNDGLLTSWLLSLMTEEVMSGIVGVENAQQIWSSLEDQLLPMTKEKEVHLMDRLATLKKGSLSVEEYVRKYKHICDCLATINKPVNDLDKVFGLARGLGYRYQDFKLAQLSKPPYPSFKQFVMALENHEQTLINFEEEKKNTINLAQAFFSQRGKGKGRGNGGFFNSKGRGFTAAGGQNLADSSGQKINYNGGKSWNNNASQSWQKSNNNPSQQGQQSWQGNSGQQWQQPQQNNSGQPWQKIQNQSKQQAEEVNEETVICQICHLPKHTAIECRRRYDYSHLTEEIPQALAAMNLDANDAKLYDDSGATTHMVNDPGLKKNLLSVGQLTHDNSCIIEFSSNKFVVKDYQGNILAKGTKTKGLYALDEGHHAALYLSEGRKAPYNIWHQRMGHPQIKSIKFLNKNKLIDVSNWITKDYVSQEIVTFPDVERWTKKEKATNKPYHTHRCHDILSLDENSSPFQQAQHEFHVNQQQVAHANPNSIGLQNTMNSNMHDLDTSQQVPREIHDIVIHTDSASTDNQASLSPSSASFEEFDITSTEQDSENNIGTGSTHLELETNTPQSTKGIDIFVDLRIPKEPETSNTHQMITRHKLRHHPELVDKMALTTTIEPKHFKTAIRQPHWRTAMLEELDALHQNNTWSLVPRPVNTNIVGSKWVYRTKFKEDGSIDKYKARLVAQGYTQIPVVTGNNTFLIDQLIHQLSIEFALKDLGQLHFFLGLEIRYFSGGIYVSQTKYTKDLLTKAKMLESTSLSTPMAIKEQANPIDHKPVNATEYRRLVGGLQYLTLTRPDIVHAVNKVCQHFQTPTEANLRAVKRILRYLKGSLDYGIRFLQQSSLNITAFCDADWGGCPDTRRSTTGYCVYMGANCISWSSKRQPTVSRSSVEVEYRALASRAAELTWITYLYREIGIPLAQPPQLLSDHLSALHMTINPVFHARSKHIELDYHFTKALSKAMFRDFRYKLGVHQMSLASLRGDVKQADQDYQKESHQRSSQQRVYHSTQLAHVKAICQGISPARFLHLNANIM